MVFNSYLILIMYIRNGIHDVEIFFLIQASDIKQENVTLFIILAVEILTLEITHLSVI